MTKLGPITCCLRMPPFLLVAVSLAIAVLSTGSSGPAAATIISYDLFNHPGSGAAPPPYGLRIDGVEWWATNAAHGGNSDTWTFNFNPIPADCASCGMVGTLNTVAKTFAIKGVALGGRDIGAAYANPGPGRLEINFTYVGVTVGAFNGHPSVSVFGDPNGTGTVKFLDANQNIAANTVVDLKGYPPSMKPFEFKADDHRLGGFCPAHEACGNPVGRGWLQFVEYNPNGTISNYHKTNYQDWLFTSKIQVPEPSTLALFVSGLAGLGFSSRLRKRRGQRQAA